MIERRLSRRLPVLRGLFSAATVFFFFDPALLAETSVQSLAEVLDRLVARNKGHGGGVARIADGHIVLWQGAAGLTAGPGSAPMTAETPFEVASITKAVTAATILRLAEDGKLSLNATLAELLPAVEVQGFDGKITLRQLLSHTSGLPDYWTDGPLDQSGNNAFLRLFTAEPNRIWRPVEMISYAREIPAKPPGKRFHYSDTNYVLLGQIVERVTGQPLQRVFRQMIFDPLGMKDTWLTYHEGRRGEAPSHRYEDAEDLNAVPRQSADWAGGGLVSTTRDLERFLRGLASGQLFHHSGTLALMRETVPVGEQDISYGLGLYVVKLSDGKGELWGHDGHGNSFAYYWPQQDITFTGTLNQTENDWWPLVEAFIEGESAEVALVDNDKSFEAALTVGYDSLYMYRGVNSLHDNGGYGSGIFWADVNLTWNFTESDSLMLDAWNCTATQGPEYREFDASLIYTHLIHDFAVNFEYDFYYGYGSGTFISNELAVGISRDWEIGKFTLTPSLSYNFSLGPDSATAVGVAKTASSYLLLRLDGKVPLYRDIVSLAGWTALGINFQYNTKDAPDDETVPFVGANNFECGLSLPIKINQTISAAAYVAYSRALADLPSTDANTFWGGCSVTFSY